MKYLTYDFGFYAPKKYHILTAGIPTIKQLISYGLTKKQARKTYRARKKHS